MNKQFAVLALWLAAMLGAVPAACASDDPEADKQFFVTRNATDPKFLTSVERLGACKATTPPETKSIRFPSELYPKQSVERQEEGTVILELIFDSDWCIRKATILQSTGFWRLDSVTLAYLMKVKYRPKPETLKQKDGEPTVVVRLGWGASQGKKH